MRIESGQRQIIELLRLFPIESASESVFLFDRAEGNILSSELRFD